MWERSAVAVGWKLSSLLGVLTGRGSTAVFDGDTVYAGSSGKGALIA